MTTVPAFHWSTVGLEGAISVENKGWSERRENARAVRRRDGAADLLYEMGFYLQM